METWILPALYGAAGVLLLLIPVLFVARRRNASRPGAKAPSATLDRAGMVQAAFDRSSVGIGFVNSDWQWLDVNRKLLSSLGYARSEMSSMPLRFLTHPEDRKREAPLFAEMRAGKRAGYSMTKRLLRKGGEYRSVRVQMLRFAETPQALFQCTVDDTPHHLSQVEMLSAALAEVEETAAILCDATGIITGWNKGAEGLFGYAAEEVLGSGWSTLHDGESRESLTRMVAAAAQNGYTRALNRRRRNDDTRVVVRSVLIADLLRGESSGFLEICHAAAAARAATGQREPEVVWSSSTGSEVGEILAVVAEESRTGVVHIRSTNGEKRFAFERGQLVSCTSNRDERLLGQLLVDAGVIDEGHRRAALDAHRSSGESFGSSIVDVSPVTDDDIAETIRAKVKREIADASSWPRVEWMFGEATGKPATDTIAVAIDVRTLLAELSPSSRLVGRANAKKRTYHVAECSAARSIPRAHTLSFESPAEAEELGYRACARCHPATRNDETFQQNAAVF